MNRRTLALVFVLALFAPPSVTFAQTFSTPIVAPAKEKETVLFDFDGGNYDGWTLTGGCWNKQPAMPKTFVDRQGNPLVSGIVGTGYLTTLFRSAATTGKAVSRDFIIDKPFLTFKIGGGYYPKEACLNLVVGGKIVRSETGNDSAELRPAYWDVYPLTGKTAHLEVVDATPNQNRGYIMLDDLRLSERSPARPQDMLEQRGIRPQFLQYSRFFENDEQRKRGRYLHFGVREEQFDRMVDAVWMKMCDKRYDPYPNISVTTIAGYVKEVASSIEQQGEKEFTAELTELGHEWLIAEAACAWCVINVKVDKRFEDAVARGEQLDTATSQLPRNTLSIAPPLAVCSGYSLILRDVTRKLGVTSHILQGRVRLPVSGGTGGHCWTVFTFPGDLHIPADASRSAERADVLKYRGKIRRFTNLPRRREEWELYHATYLNWTPIPRNIIARGDPRESVVLLDVAEADWLAFDTYGQFRDLYFPLRTKLLFR